MDKMVGQEAFDVSKIMHACTLDMVCCEYWNFVASVKKISIDETFSYAQRRQWGRIFKFRTDRTWIIWKHWPSRCTFAQVLRRDSNSLHNQFISIDCKANSECVLPLRLYLQAYATVSRRLQVHGNVRAASAAVINARKIKYFENHPITDERDESDESSDDQESYATPQIFIDKLFRLYSKKMIDDKAIKDQVNLMIFAGNDTSGLTLAHAAVLLGMHPEVQQRVFDEVDRVFEGLPLDAPVTHEHLLKLTYVEQVIRETLRLYPAAPYMLRFCKGDTPITKCTIPRGPSSSSRCTRCTATRQFGARTPTSSTPTTSALSKWANETRARSLPSAWGRAIASACATRTYPWK